MDEGKGLPSWRFHVENLGCVKSGDFEVKPLTLLCGPNNTGKTWVMYALYGFLTSSFNSCGLPGIKCLLEDATNEYVYSWDFGGWVKSHAKTIINIINKANRQGLPSVFNAPDNTFSESRLDWVIDQERLVQSSISRTLDFRLKLGSNNKIFHMLKPAGDTKAKITLMADKVPDLYFYVSAVLVAYLLGLEGAETTRSGQVFLIPAERNGLHLFFRELAYRRTALLHPSSRVGIDLDNISHYAKPVADYIDWLNKVPDFLKWKSDQCQILAKQVEIVAGGSYAVDADGNISFTPKETSNILDFHLSSSTVKSLFGLWFYLGHEAKVGDTLMIDEPELNLHPANQRSLARLLARLVNAGLRVVISTHSDYIVREINSLIMLNRPHHKREELMRRYGYQEEEVLSPDKVAAYLFDQSTIKAMDVTQDEGILASTFDETIHDLNNTSDGIYYTYRDMLEEDAQ